MQLPNGIPSHDTFGRLFARIAPNEFRNFFNRMVQDLAESLMGKTVAIDGRTSKEKAYFISSFKNRAPTIAMAIREH